MFLKVPPLHQIWEICEPAYTLRMDAMYSVHKINSKLLDFTGGHATNISDSYSKFHSTA